MQPFREDFTLHSDLTLQLIDDDILDGLSELETEGEPSIVRELIDMFIEDSHALMAGMTTATEAGDIDELREFAHKLKGACKQLGATRMVALCQEIESKAIDGILSNVNELIIALSAACRETLQALNDRYPA